MAKLESVVERTQDGETQAFADAVVEHLNDVAGMYQLPTDALTWMAGGNFDAAMEQQFDL
jgi:hypothetical protein